MIKSVHLENTRTRDALMRMTFLLNEKNTLENFVSNLTDMEVLLVTLSDVLSEFFDHVFTETDFTSKIRSVDWLSGVKSFICFGWSMDKNSLVFSNDNQVITE